MPTGAMPRYIQRNFDPWTLNMDSIRDILLQHKIKPPTGLVRKSELVALFEQHIRPLTQSMRDKYEMDHKEEKRDPPASSSSSRKVHPSPFKAAPAATIPQFAASASSTLMPNTSTSTATTEPQTKTVKTKRRPAIPDAIQNSVCRTFLQNIIFKNIYARPNTRLDLTLLFVQLFDTSTVTESDSEVISDASRGRISKRSKRLALQQRAEDSTDDTQRKVRHSLPRKIDGLF